jgi:hypothetical protein
MSDHPVPARAFLGRRSQGRQASGANGSTGSTTERREPSIPPRGGCEERAGA